MSIDLEFAIKKDIRNNPIIREVDAQQKQEFRHTLVIVAIVVTMVLFWAWPHLQVVRGTQAIETLRLQIQEAQARNRHLRLELATVTSPKVVHDRARRLRFETPTEKETVVLERIEPPRRAATGNAIVADAGGRVGR
jgi:hypothetical protein